MTHVRIYRPSRAATQSGKAKSKKWFLKFETEDHMNIEPLMGWVSSEDTNRQLKISFDSIEDAIEYCRGHGLIYTITSANSPSAVFKNYGDNFTNPRIRGV